MLVKVLFGQRKETYKGEYCPEALAVMTEYDDDENPDYLTEQLAKYEASNEFESLKVVDIDVAHRDIMNILRPVKNVVQGDVQ